MIKKKREIKKSTFKVAGEEGGNAFADGGKEGVEHIFESIEFRSFFPHIGEIAKEFEDIREDHLTSKCNLRLRSLVEHPLRKPQRRLPRLHVRCHPFIPFVIVIIV